MKGPTLEEDPLFQRVRRGEMGAVGDLFVKYQDRLHRMIRLRLDRRLQGRVDSSDVLQESFVEICRRIGDYLSKPTMPFYLWVRFITGQKLQELHRKHLGTQMRNVGREVSLHRRALPQASSIALAAQLLGKLSTPSEAVMRAEIQMSVQDALNRMDATDREILAMRHFEELSNNEAAEALGLSKAAASNRYIRALKRLRKILAPYQH